MVIDYDRIPDSWSGGLHGLAMLLLATIGISKPSNFLSWPINCSNWLYTRPRTCTPRIAKVPEFPVKFHRTPHLMLYLHTYIYSNIYLQVGWNHHPFSAYVTFDCSSAEWWMYRGRLNSFASSDSFLRCQVRKDEPGNQGSLGVGSHCLVQN